MPLTDVWIASGVLLGFQTTSFLWRVGNEAARAKEGDITWLPPADLVNLAAMIVLVLGVLVAPATVWAGRVGPAKAFGLSAVLFVGHCFCLAGHYEMFNSHTRRSMVYFPLQERVSVVVVVVVAVAYMVAASCA